MKAGIKGLTQSLNFLESGFGQGVLQTLERQADSFLQSLDSVFII